MEISLIKGFHLIFYFRNHLYNSTPSLEGIKITNKMTINLKNTLDTLDLIPEIDEKLAEESNIKNNFLEIFKMKKVDVTKSNDLEEINKFNLSIINNIRWGSESLTRTKNEPIRKGAIKPTKKEIEKEVGKNIFF